jgi:hypothetical protein
MTGEQRVAFDNPCRFGFETLHPRFRHLRPGASLILTVNSGYE